MVRSHRFDVSIDPQSLTKSAILPWLARIPVRIGFARGVGRELAPILNNHKVQPRTAHVIDRTMELLKPLGIENRQVHFQMPIHPAADENIVTFLRQARLTDRFAVLNPGAGWPSRVWPAQRYADVAKFLAQKCNLASVVVWAGDQEREWANTIVSGSTGKTTLAPRTNLRELAALLARATLFVGSDTGPLHLAVAVGTRCVSMFGPTRPKHSGPYGKQHVALQQFYQAGTSRQRRGGDNLAMRAIQVDAVCSACEQVLSDELAPSVDQAA